MQLIVFQFVLRPAESGWRNIFMIIEHLNLLTEWENFNFHPLLWRRYHRNLETEEKISKTVQIRKYDSYVSLIPDIF